MIKIQTMIKHDIKIISPMATGNGAHRLHKMIESGIKEYRVVDYSPWLTMVPFLLPSIIRNRHCDIVHATHDYGCFFRKKGIPLVLTIHLYMSDKSIMPYSNIAQQIHYRTDLKWFTKKSMDAATVLVSVSKYLAEQIRRELNLEKEIKVLYNGVDEAIFRPADNPVNDTKTIRVLFSGNFTRRKGAHWLPAIASLLEPGIVIYYTSGLRGTAWPVRSCSNMKPLGSIRPEHMPALYQSHDILLAPSVREGFGLSIAEAMACGIPVVASNCSSIPELVDDGMGGFLCEIGDVQSFAEKLNLLASSRQLRQEMGEYNRAKVEKMFSLSRMVSKYQQLFSSIL